MGTRSYIAVKLSDGRWKCVYCHWDGYPSWNGKILYNHYNSQELAEALVAPGDMSSLDKKCDKPEGHTYDTPAKDYTVYYRRDRGYYRRDRGETESDGVIGNSLEEVLSLHRTAGACFIYVWENGVWYVCSDTTHLVSLRIQLSKIADKNGDGGVDDLQDYFLMNDL